MLLKEYILIVKKIVKIIEDATGKKVYTRPDGLFNGKPVIDRKLHGIHFDNIYIHTDLTEIISELGTLKINFKINLNDRLKILKKMRLDYKNNYYVLIGVALRDMYSIDDINELW